MPGIGGLGGPHIPYWFVLVVALVVLIVVTALVLALWGRSRRWAASSRLHRLASRNEKVLRADTRRELIATARTLHHLAGGYRRLGQEGAAAELERLARGVEFACDRVAADFVPSPVNLAHRRRDDTLERLGAAEALREASEALDPALPLHTQLADVVHLVEWISLEVATR